MRIRLRPLFLFSCSMLVAGSAMAQYTIDLGEERMDLPGCTFTVDSVVLAFGEKEAIGSVMRGMMNEQQPAYMAHGVPQAFKELCVRSHATTPGDRHIVLQVDGLKVTEFSGGGGELAICSLRCEMLARTDSGWSHLYDVGERLTSNGGMDATHKHARNIALALTHCLTRFQQRLNAGALAAQAITADRVGKASPARLVDPRTGRAVVPARGVLRSFMDLRENTPDTVTPFEVRETVRSTATVKALRVKSSEDKDIRDAWGISDGTSCYFNTGSDFVQLQADTSGLYTYWSPSAAYDANDFAAQMAFGLIGLAISRANKDHVPHRFDVDPGTGELTMHYSAGSGHTSGAPHTVLYSKNSRDDVPVRLLLADGRTVTLRRGQYHVLRMKRAAEMYALDLSLGDGSAPTRASIDAGRKGDDLVLINVKNGLIVVDHPPNSVASSMLNDLDPAAEVK